MNQIETFDTMSWIISRGVSYQSEGKDVRAGWIGVKCPFCTSPDPHHHLGINISDSRFTRNYIHCWRCRARGDIRKFIVEVERCTWGKANQIVESLQDRTLLHLRTEAPRSKVTYGQNILPSEASKEFMFCHTEFLKSRRYDPDYVIKQYDLYGVGLGGKYKYRLVIPVTVDYRVVTFIARDTTGVQDPPYLACPIEQSFIFSKQCVYGIDWCKEIGVVVEGVLDAWRVGDGALATFGIEFTNAQVNMISAKCKKRVYILYDAEPDAALEQADKLAWNLSLLMPRRKVEVLKLPAGDPDSLSDDDARWLRKELFGKE